MSDRTELDTLYARFAGASRAIDEMQGHHTKQHLTVVEEASANIDAWLTRDRARERAEALEGKATELYADETAERGSTKAAYHAIYAAWLLDRAARIRSGAGIGGGGDG